MQSYQSPKNLREAFRAFYRYRFRAAGVFALVIVLTLTAIAVWPRQYASESKLFVRLGRESVSLDPTATLGQTVALNESRETEINSVLEMMSGRAVLEKVVDKLGPEEVLKKAPAESDGDTAQTAAASPMIDLGPMWQTAYGVFASLRLADPVDQRERAINHLASNISVYSPRRSSIAVVHYRAASPEQAQRMVDAVVRAYQEEHLKAHRTLGSLEFFQEQARTTAEELEYAQQRLREAKTRYGLALLDERRTNLQQQIGGLETQLREVEANLSAALAEVDSLEQLLANIPERLLTDQVSGLANQAADAMRNRLYDLQVREQEMLAQYEPTHPRVQAIREQVRQAEEIFQQENLDRQQQTSTINPTYQPLQLRLLMERGRSDALRAQQQELRDQKQRLAQSIAELNTNEIELMELQRQVDLLESHYLKYSQNLEQARINDALALDRITNVNVVQPATLVAKPVSPRKQVMLGFGLIIAFGAGIAVVILSDYLNQSLRSADEVEEALELPVLASIPQLSRRQLAETRQPVAR